MSGLYGRDKEAFWTAERYDDVRVITFSPYGAQIDSDLIEANSIDSDGIDLTLEERILRLSEYANSKEYTDLYRKFGAKAMSATLLRVHQRGDWASGRENDRKMRELIHSPLLEERGFSFKETYDDVPAESIKYSAIFAGYGGVLLGVRTRPIADLQPAEGEYGDNTVEIVKRSIFVVKRSHLDTEGRRIIKSLASKESEGRRSVLRREFGEKIISPALDRTTRPDYRRSVLPAVATYFALIRLEPREAAVE